MADSSLRRCPTKAKIPGRKNAWEQFVTPDHSKSSAATRRLLSEVRGCTLCAAHLPLGPRPVLQLAAAATILIAGQAPGRKVHASGDLPPRPECAATWRKKLLQHLPRLELTLAIGQYAQHWHLGEAQRATLTETVRAWRDYWPSCLPLPHPSPRNNIWLRRNAWFAREVLPPLRKRVDELLRTRG